MDTPFIDQRIFRSRYQIPTLLVLVVIFSVMCFFFGQVLDTDLFSNAPTKHFRRPLCQHTKKILLSSGVHDMETIHNMFPIHICAWKETTCHKSFNWLKLHSWAMHHLHQVWLAANHKRNFIVPVLSIYGTKICWLLYLHMPYNLLLVFNDFKSPITTRWRHSQWLSKSQYLCW